MKLLLSIMMMFASLSSSFPVGTTLSVITNFAYLYETPSLTSSKYDFQLPKGCEVDLIDEVLTNDFYHVSCTYNNINYQGYIYKENLSKVSSNQDVVLKYNGRIVNKTQIYNADMIELKTSDGTNIILEENHEIYLYEGYDHNAEYNAIKFSYNNEIYLGYVKTYDIAPYGVSTTLIIALTAITSCVGIILILLGINKRKLKVTPIAKENSD